MRAKQDLEEWGREEGEWEGGRVGGREGGRDEQLIIKLL